MSASPPLGAWSPGLDETETLRSVYDRMPGDPATAIPAYVRLLENPASPFALPGAIDLFGHDCIHILLGRGMRVRDEAFVIGVTMGASGELTAWQHHLYALCARFLFRGPYRLSRTDRLVFDLAVNFARNSGIRPLHRVDWRRQMDRTLGELRAELGVDPEHLIIVSDAERLLGDSAARRERTGVPSDLNRTG